MYICAKRYCEGIHMSLKTIPCLYIEKKNPFPSVQATNCLYIFLVVYVSSKVSTAEQRFTDMSREFTYCVYVCVCVCDSKYYVYTCFKHYVCTRALNAPMELGDCTYGSKQDWNHSSVLECVIVRIVYILLVRNSNVEAFYRVSISVCGDSGEGLGECKNIILYHYH